MPPAHSDEGLTTAEALRRARPDLGVLLLSTCAEAEWAVRLLQDGGHGLGYLLKDRVDDGHDTARHPRTVNSPRSMTVAGDRLLLANFDRVPGGRPTPSPASPSPSGL